MAIEHPAGAPEPAGKGMLYRTLALLRFVATAGEAVGASEVARRTSLPKTTAHRLLTTLETHGTLRRIGTRYVIDERTGWPVPAARTTFWNELRRTVKPYLIDIFQQTGQAVSLVVLENPVVRCLDSLFTRAQMDVVMATGDLAPAEGTAAGRLLLAYSFAVRTELDLDAVRERGVARQRAAGFPDMVALAAPVFGRARRVVAALSVAGAAADVDCPPVESVLRSVAHSAGLQLRRRAPTERQFCA